MSFMFNFSRESEADKPEPKRDHVEWFDSEEVVPKTQMKDLNEIAKHAKMFTCGEVEIGHVVTSEALANILSDTDMNNATGCAEKSHSDLVTAKYEGGLKIWECTYDLVEYLKNNSDTIKLESAKVLDLGCGAGILGIYAFINGAHVTFQDYNKEVLEHVTIPNVLLNIDEEDNVSENIRKCKFYSGDWESFNKIDETESYDVILTSETIYNIANYDKLINLFIKRLSRTGAVYLAAKTCYFGVGGGVRQFESKLKNNGTFQSEICWTCSGGIQREILKITHRL
ncbi:histidine protein methyltransferase 1 homolog isoform X2 [Amyelois transitella]|uniref:histidine protein methyltransferase 1 homolog isoform X2 n=1 Tax=Amyelois transitella TaxID=680683 RepID=UPI00067DAF87|nr:histidine protein methyltransferase 1 homolog isoform X2 [Amyelois transitella]